MSGLEPPDSPRVTSTIDAVRGALTTGEGLIYRYREAKVQQEGAFLACSFWLVDALVRTGRVGEAARVMECGLRWGGELGLFGEEFDVRGGMMGNFPLALTHSSLVMAACALEQAGVRAA
jgi:GH15 family glucan-1,4-alpha-glucosidase